MAPDETTTYQSLTRENAELRAAVAALQAAVAGRDRDIAQRDAEIARLRKSPLAEARPRGREPARAPLGRPLMALRARPAGKVLPPVHANVGLRAEYRRRLEALVAEMAKSYARWLLASYRANPPRMATDATPAAELKRAVDDLAGQWRKNFDHAAPRLARWFAQSTERRSSAALQRILKDGGFTVKFKMTPTMRDVFDASIAENVGLIRSIPQQFHTEIQGLVMRSVQSGRDLGGLAKELQARFGVTQRRAALIARDQNNKMTGAFDAVRQLEVGGDDAEAVWMHSHGGKEPRPTHLANDGNRYKVAEGWYDPDPRVRRRIRPGELINCRCRSRLVVKGFS